MRERPFFTHLPILIRLRYHATYTSLFCRTVADLPQDQFALGGRPAPWGRLCRLQCHSSRPFRRDPWHTDSDGTPCNSAHCGPFRGVWLRVGWPLPSRAAPPLGDACLSSRYPQGVSRSEGDEAITQVLWQRWPLILHRHLSEQATRSVSRLCDRSHSRGGTCPPQRSGRHLAFGTVGIHPATSCCFARDPRDPFGWGSLTPQCRGPASAAAEFDREKKKYMDTREEKRSSQRSLRWKRKK